MPHTSTAASTVDASTAAPSVPAQTVVAVAALFDEAVALHRTAGVTWAIIGGHAHDQTILAHGAAGHRELEGGVPVAGSTPMDRGTISRIASMTKSFTAATVLALRDEGTLRLDDRVEQYLPEAAGALDAPSDMAPLTLRELLTMSAGLVTDNPWGDRQESMTREQFAALLRGGLSHTHRPGTGFEYSNTGFSMLGRVIDEVTGSDYTAEIRRRFLEPLGMTDTAFETSGLDAARLATGHRIADRADATRFEAVPFDRPGVYGAMAGLYSTVDDVAAWVRFLAAADAVDAAERDQSLLRTSSRREMQQLHRHHPLPALPVGEDGTSPGYDRVRGYGFGLVIEQFPDLGQVVSHSGGYPGYGSFMVWHRESGVGVVALANSKYAPATPLSMQALRILRDQVPELLAPRTVEPAPRTVQAAAAALDWLRGAGDALAEKWFADNMDPDTPRAERRRRLEAALEAAGLEAGALGGLQVTDATALSRAHLRWTVPGASDGSLDLRIDLQMDPRREALIQGLDTIAVSRT